MNGKKLFDNRAAISYLMSVGPLVPKERASQVANFVAEELSLSDELRARNSTPASAMGFVEIPNPKSLAGFYDLGPISKFMGNPLGISFAVPMGDSIPIGDSFPDILKYVMDALRAESIDFADHVSEPGADNMPHEGTGFHDLKAASPGFPFFSPPIHGADQIAVERVIRLYEDNADGFKESVEPVEELHPAAEDKSPQFSAPPFHTLHGPLKMPAYSPEPRSTKDTPYDTQVWIVQHDETYKAHLVQSRRGLDIIGISGAGPFADLQSMMVSFGHLQPIMAGQTLELYVDGIKVDTQCDRTHCGQPEFCLNTVPGALAIQNDPKTSKPYLPADANPLSVGRINHMDLITLLG